MFNKLDLLTEEDADERAAAVIEALAWDGHVYRISALAGEGTERVCQDVMNYLESLDPNEDDAADDEPESSDSADQSGPA